MIQMTADIGVTRVEFLKVPVDIITEERFEEVVRYMTTNDKVNQIVFLDFLGLFRARTNQEYLNCLKNAALVVPVSSLIVKGMAFLKIMPAPLYRPFPFIIKLLGHLERLHKTIYLLGGTRTVIQASENTLKASFPGAQFIGRFAADFPQEMEKNILLAIKKASPSLLLAGKGLKGKDLWLYRHRKMVNSGIFLWDKTCYDVFSGRKKKPPVKNGALFIQEFNRSLFRPWKFLVVFLYLWFLLLLVIYRLKR
jgi:N-acetylglucosaminyldiphosphoundecaprenol N-acetyl-beta-D-mannosaminyltransferase